MPVVNGYESFTGQIKFNCIIREMKKNFTSMPTVIKTGRNEYNLNLTSRSFRIQHNFIVVANPLAEDHNHDRFMDIPWADSTISQTNTNCV